MKSFLTCGVYVSIGLFAGSAAEAQELNGGAVEDLALQATWDAEEDSYGYWDWNEDGSLCLRLHQPTGDCADRGTWATDGDFICYELEWWGEGYGQRAACISVVAHGGEPYEVRYQGDALVSTMFHFTLLE